MSGEKRAEQLLRKTVAAIIGDGLHHPLGTIDLSTAVEGAAPAAALLHRVAEGGDGSGNGGLLSSIRSEQKADEALRRLLERGIETFVSYYCENPERREEVLSLFAEGIDPNLLAEDISLVWAPELRLSDEEILPKWQLSNLESNPRPIEPTEVVLQFNALYTVPETIPEGLPGELAEEGRRVMRDPGKKIADYDHPVHLFDSGKSHELESCLSELDEEIAFEKERGVLPQDYRVPILLSVSVTHEGIDELAGKWIHELVEEGGYRHLKVFVLTEGLCRTIREDLFDGDFPLFSVIGKYARHFNALKYGQLLLEKAVGIRAGFKLDTDEGIRSRDLYEATGATWFQTMCHPYWGGMAKDPSGGEVELAVNEGEYINSSDIDRLGFAHSLRTPDVTVPDTWTGPSMFFQKGFAHGRATALYNRFDSVEDGISHPVVKGGGYGISNEGLRRAAPFTFSWVGRAEDQQFYFSGLDGGIRGIFQPNLRIAHYKGAVAGSEKKTAAGRFLGDMYRLILFRALVEKWGVKEKIDPMPGIFAGSLARAQAVFSLLYKSCEFASRGNAEAAGFLLAEGAAELLELEERIDDGSVGRLVDEEAEHWRRFVSAVEKVEPKKVQKTLRIE